MNAIGKIGVWILGLAMLPFVVAADPVPPAPAIPIGPLTFAAKAVRITDLMGKPVTGRKGQQMGSLSDVVFDLRDGRVKFTVVTTLEDERRIAAPASLLKIKSDGNALAMGCSEQHFRAASDFSQSDLRDPSWAGANEAFFGVTPSGHEMAQGPIIVEAAGAELSQFSALPKTPEAAIAPPQTGAPLVRWSDLAGNAVKDNQGQPLGDIKDMVMEWPGGKILFAVLDASGIDGLSQQYIAIAPCALKPSSSGGSFMVDASKKDLAAAPGFDRTQWPSRADQAFVEHVNHFYSQFH